MSAVNRLMCTSEDTFSVETAKRWVGISSTELLIQTWIINLTHSSLFRPAVDSLHYGGCVYITEWIECQKLPACERLDGGKRGGRWEEESRRAGEPESREGYRRKRSFHRMEKVHRGVELSLREHTGSCASVCKWNFCVSLHWKTWLQLQKVSVFHLEMRGHQIALPDL